VSDQQLWLFPQPKPLRERLGDEFFRKAPACPGVYIMTDRQERVLYIGQSQNLRRRLNTYKTLRPEKGPRKLVRLAQAAEKISWETCSCAQSARLRENELLRLHRPKFNWANTHPEAYGYIGLDVSAEGIALWLAATMDSGDKLYGAFKSVRWHAYAALVRLLHCVGSGALTPETFPLRLLGRNPPRRLHLHARPGVLEQGQLLHWLHLYFAGESGELILQIRQLLPPPDKLPVFWQKLQASDLETAETFYEAGPRRNRQLKQRLGITERLIRPADLDDLVTLSRNESGS
jgi:hypothetical protein